MLASVKIRPAYRNPASGSRLTYFSFVMGLYGVGFWLPTIIKATGVKDALTIGPLSAIPFGAAVIAVLLVARSADKSGERRWHIAIPAAVGALGLVISVIWSTDTPLAMLGLTLATMGGWRIGKAGSISTARKTPSMNGSFLISPFSFTIQTRPWAVCDF
jgi:MFS family permease